MECQLALFSPRPLYGTCIVPGSKSITNRALVLAALASRTGPCQLHGALASEDTEVMVESLIRLGWKISCDLNQGQIAVSRHADSDIHRLIPSSSAELNLANSGTSMRFLTAICSLGNGSYKLDGVSRMRERPLGDLLSSLSSLGIDYECHLKSGCPPVTVKSNGWQSKKVGVSGNVSSQFISGIMLAAPWCGHDMSIAIEGKMVSEPYVTMTLQMLRQWNVTVEETNDGSFHITHSPNAYRESYSIEPDASAASYFWGAAAITGGRLKVKGLTKSSLQGDVGFVDVLGKMGCDVLVESDSITVSGKAHRGVDVDMNSISDTVMTLAAVALFANSPTTIRNIGHIRHKETDRLSAISAELRKIGAVIEETETSIRIEPGNYHEATLCTYKDHRMAMSLALAGLRIPGIIIEDPHCVAKTYPRFFKDLEKLVMQNQ
jgi:3-phosphoshikimate 1-carboxyvinyltransferase